MSKIPERLGLPVAPASPARAQGTHHTSHRAGRRRRREQSLPPGGTRRSELENLPETQETPVSWVGKFPWRRDRLPTPVFLGFPGGSDGKKSTCNVGDLGSIPGLGRSPGEGKGYLLQYSGLENSMDCIVHRVAKSWND